MGALSASKPAPTRPPPPPSQTKMPFSSISMGGGGGGGGTYQRPIATAKSYDEFDEFFDGPAKNTQARPAKPTGLLSAGAATSRAPPPLRPLGEPMKLAAGVSALGSGVSQMGSQMGSTMGAMAAAMGSAYPPVPIAPPPSPASTNPLKDGGSGRPLSPHGGMRGGGRNAGNPNGGPDNTGMRGGGARGGEYTPPSFGSAAKAPPGHHSAAAAAAAAAPVKRPPARSNACTGLFLALVLLTSAISGTHPITQHHRPNTSDGRAQQSSPIAQLAGWQRHVSVTSDPRSTLPQRVQQPPRGARRDSLCGR